VTEDRFILSGHEERDEAVKRGQATVRCLQHEFDEEQIIDYLASKPRSHQGLNDFCRVLVALEGKEVLRSLARRNQQLGGKHKVSTKLTELEPVDVRKSIASKTGVSQGSVAKVQRILKDGIPGLVEALKSDQIAIDPACRLLNQQASQEELLNEYFAQKSNRFVSGQLRQLVKRRQQPKAADRKISVDDLCHALTGMSTIQKSEIYACRVNAPGKSIAISASLAELIDERLGIEYGDQ